ncbi:MAG: acyl carrier protein [Anaerolineae bacterium]|nr:acyl carrier protein [Anaerolineae bacterium]
MTEANLTDSQKEILAKITDVVIDVLGREKDEITLDKNFRDDLEADSLDLVELIMGFEDAFEVQEKISDEAVQDILTVGDAVKYIDDLMKQG